MVTQEMHGILRMTGGITCAEPIMVSLQYSKEDPLIVHAKFSWENGGEANWEFSRTFLHEGARSIKPVGEGDVKMMYQIFPVEQVLFCLKTPEGHAHVGLPARPLWAFLERTKDACALDGVDEEQALDSLVDVAIERILGRDGAA